MSYSEDLVLDRPREMGFTAAEAPLDLAAVHTFRFFSQRWFAGVSSLTKGSLMILIGGFLYSQIPSTPNLVIQMAVIATLLVLGGMAFCWLAWREFAGYLTIDQQGYRASFGVHRFSGNWSEVATWRMGEPGHSGDLPALQIWTNKDNTLHAIPAGFISAAEFLHLGRLFRAFVPGKNTRNLVSHSH